MNKKQRGNCSSHTYPGEKTGLYARLLAMGKEALLFFINNIGLSYCNSPLPMLIFLFKWMTVKERSCHCWLTELPFPTTCASLTDLDYQCGSGATSGTVLKVCHQWHCFCKRNAGMLFPAASLLTILEKAPSLQENKCWQTPRPARHVVWDSSLAMMQRQVWRPSSMHEARDSQAFLPIPSAPHPQSSPHTYPPDVKLLPTLSASERSTLWNPTKP